MQNEQDFSNLIYEYFFLHIRFGYYRCGDSLPPIDTLCREFNVAPLTVTAALRRLRSEGFISKNSASAFSQNGGLHLWIYMHPPN